jgi:hypothetical protein
MPPQLIAAIAAAAHPSEIDLEQLQRSESEGLLGALVGQRARLQLLSEMAFEAREVSAATAVERSITSSLELTSKLLGMLVSRTEVRSILVSSDYLKLRQTIISALRPFPEASRSLTKARPSIFATSEKNWASATWSKAAYARTATGSE